MYEEPQDRCWSALIDPLRNSPLRALQDGDELPNLHPWEEDDDWESFDPQPMADEDWEIGLELDDEPEPEPGDFWREVEDEDW